MPYSSDPRRGYFNGGPRKPPKQWTTSKWNGDPPCDGPCPYCMETVRKASGNYLDFDGSAFVQHRHQPQKVALDSELEGRRSPGTPGD